MIHFDLAKLKDELQALNKKIDDPQFWNNQKEALEVTSRKNENGITREVLKCPNCGKEELL